jgi:hypothetical protein
VVGQKHREERKHVKAQARALERQGWYENEFGELKKRTTKANARRWLVRFRRTLDEMTRASLEAGEKLLESLRPQARQEILDALSDQIVREMDRMFW